MKNTNTIEHHIPKSVRDLIGVLGEDFEITGILGTGMVDYYPSIADDGTRLHYSHPNYLKYKKKMDRLAVRLSVNGSPIAAEDYIRQHTNYRAMATGLNVVDVYINIDLDFGG